jgi:cobalt-zinc-cadmium efflux system outer membrane protein
MRIRCSITRPLVLSLGLYLLAVPRPVSAAPSSPPPQGCELKATLEEFRAHALANSPLVAEIDRDYATQLAKAIDTRLWANPELSAEETWTRMYVGGANDPQSSVALSQPMKLSNFGNRDKVAELLRKAGDTEKNIKLLGFTQETTVNFVRLYSLQATVRILQLAEDDAARKVAAVRKQVKEGLLSQGSEALFQGEKHRLEAQRIGAEASLATLRSELAMSLGTTCSVVATRAPSFGKIPAAEVLLDKARSSHISEKARYDLIQELTTEQLRLAELDAFPVVAPRVVYQHTNDGGDFVGAGITIPLPLWNRNQAEITRASAERELAQRKSNLINSGGLELQVTSSHAAAVSSERQAEIYSAHVEAAFKTALTSEERAYASGKGGVLDVWQTFRALNEAQVTSLSLRQQAALARARLSILVGEEV